MPRPPARPLLAALLAGLCLSAPAALAQQQQPQPTAPAQPALPATTERLTVMHPATWQPATSDRRGNVSITRYLPQGQTLENWQELLAVQTFSGLKNAMPDAFLDRVVQLSRENCEDPGAGPLSQQSVNNYPTALRVVACPKNRQGKGEVTAFLVVAGKDTVYVVQRAWRGQSYDKAAGLPVPKEMLTEWLAFMKSVSLCDLSDPKHVCPPQAADGPK